MISIIIPAYNAAKDINIAINSILKQTYTDYEIIVVDDHSTDETCLIVQKLVEENSKIRLLHNSLKGVSSARNFGIKNSVGDYIVFLDADDYVHDSFLSVLLQMIQISDCDLAAVAYTNNYTDLNTGANDFELLNGSDCYDTLTGIYPDIKGYVWNKIYLSKIIKSNSIYFDENIVAGEDLLFNINYYKYVNKIGLCRNKLYYYRLCTSSAINRLDNPKWFGIMDVYQEIINSNFTQKVKDVFIYNYAILILEAEYRLKYCNNNKYTQHVVCELKKKYVFLSKKYSFEQNIKLVLFMLFPEISMKYRRRSIKEKKSVS